MIRYKTPPRSDAERRQRAGFSRWFDEFDCAAQAWRELAEYETRLYPAELREHREKRPPPQLKAYMLATAGQPRTP